MFSQSLHPRIFAGALAALSPCLSGTTMACGVDSGVATASGTNARAEILLDDGRWLRLAGLYMAEPEAARALLVRDWIGKRVALALVAAEPDRWGRWLADVSTLDGESAAVALLSEGFARARPEFETRGCEGERLDAESAARAAGQGVWARPDAVLGAADLDALRVNDGRFVVVEGVVRRVGAGRSRVYLDFGRRAGFTVVVARKLAPAFERLGVAVSAFAGRTVRVRGVLETRFGPRIEVNDPLMIETVEASKETKSGG
jgi:hypothetical protein